MKDGFFVLIFSSTHTQYQQKERLCKSEDAWLAAEIFCGAF